jgi:hypothetical protein
MYNRDMVRSCLMSALVATVVGSSLGPIPARAMDSDAGSVQLAQYGCKMFGPYATMDRANQIANVARNYGHGAIAFHNGDGYYVRVC